MAESCLSPNANQNFRTLSIENRGKIWLDIYPDEHQCLKTLGLEEAWKALKFYGDVDKSNKDLLPKRLDTLEALRQTMLSARTALAGTYPNRVYEELDYIIERVEEKSEHLQNLDQFLKRAAKVKRIEDLVRPPRAPMSVATLVKKPDYTREIIFHLDPGLRHDKMSFAWKDWVKISKANNNLITLPSFYLWLESQKRDFPLAKEDFRDNSGIKVNIRGTSYQTDKYGSFAQLENLDPDEVDEGAPTFLYVLSEDDELYIAQTKDLAMHSLFLHGAPVKGAGMLSIKDGKINYINRMSGHYRPTAELFRNAVKIIKSRYPGIFSQTAKFDEENQ